MSEDVTSEVVAAYAAKMLARLSALAEEHPELADLQALVDAALQEALLRAGIALAVG